MIAIIDYGAGNLFSVKNALEFLKKDCVITADAEEIRKADAMILPESLHPDLFPPAYA